MTACRQTSSSCTGAFTAELSLAALENIINNSRRMTRPVDFRPVSCHVPRLALTLFLSLDLGALTRNPAASQEWSASCRQLIIDHFAWLRKATGKACKMPCVFGDLTACLPEGSYEESDSFMQKLESIDRADLMASQYCYTHNRSCPLFGCKPGSQSQLEVAGLPCWDMSAAGKRKREAGRTAPVFLAHAKQHIEKETALIIIENTKARRS